MITVSEKSELILLDANLNIISRIPNDIGQWRVSLVAVFNNHVVYMKNASEAQIVTYEIQRDSFLGLFE
jgi:hypothetical protein